MRSSVETLNHLLRHFLHVPDKSVVGCPADLVGVYGAFEGIPVGAQCLVGFSLGGFGLFSVSPLLRSRTQNRSRHIAPVLLHHHRRGTLRMRSCVASMTSGEVMERLNTLTGIVFTKVWAWSWVPATSRSKSF